MFLGEAVCWVAGGKTTRQRLRGQLAAGWPGFEAPFPRWHDRQGSIAWQRQWPMVAAIFEHGALFIILMQAQSGCVFYCSSIVY
jgi:hypothetical protein